MTPTPEVIEGTIGGVVRGVKLTIEIFGAGLMTLGVCVGVVQLCRSLAAREPAEFARAISGSHWSSNPGRHPRRGDFAELGSDRHARCGRCDTHMAQHLPVDGDEEGRNGREGKRGALVPQSSRGQP